MASTYDDTRTLPDNGRTQRIHVTEPSTSHPQAAPPEPERRRGDGWKILLVVLVVLLTAAVTGLVVYLLTSDDSPLIDDTTPIEETAPGEAQVPSGDTGGGSASDGGAAPSESDVCSRSQYASAVGGSIDGIPVTMTDFACTTADGGYAWAEFAPTDPTMAVDAVSVYFRYADGGVQIVDYGTGLSCRSSGVPAGACADLP